MRSKFSKGFTLIELLVTILLLAVVGGIVIYNMTSVTTSSKETEYTRFVSTVKSAASVYADTNPDIFNELYVSRAWIYIKIDDLIKEGLIDSDLVNPYTENKIGKDEIVKANLDSTSGALSFTYPFVDEKEESSLVAISDYVIWGEPYDCMRGEGSYELSLADEDGNLIDLTSTDENGVDIKTKYNFTCSMPSTFDYYNDPYTGVKGLRTTNPGNYEITYNWITESGTKKRAKRILRVLAQVVPTFSTNVPDYDFRVDSDKTQGDTFKKCRNCDNSNYYQTSMNYNGSWNTLTYEPVIDGADKATTLFRISKRSNNPANNTWVNVTNGYVNDYTEHQVDDGDKTYKIDVKVVGHYVRDYSYEATGYARFKAELVIPEEYISYDGFDEWGFGRNFNISSVNASYQSPVGILRYEYRFSNEENLKKSLSIDNANIIEKSPGTTTKYLSIFTGTESDYSSYEFKYIYFRAINKDGYVGTWTKMPANFSNTLSNILESNSYGCENSNSCCAPIDDGVCFFSDKVTYISYDDNLFVVLEKFADGTVLVALNEDTGELVNPISSKTGVVEQETFSGTYYKYYDYYVQNDEINNNLKNWFDGYIINTNKVVSPALPNGNSSNIIIPTIDMINKYRYALDNNGKNIWLSDTHREPFSISTDDEDDSASTTAYNTYNYFASGISTTPQYAGQTEYIKPIIRLSDVNIIAGDGTKDNPYIVS